MTNSATTPPTVPESNRDEARFESYLRDLRAGEPELVPHWIDNEEIRDGEVIWREDPTHPDQNVSGCYDAPAEVVDAALAAARKAQPEWDAIGPEARAKLLLPMLELLDDDRLARIAAKCALETGKSRTEAFIEAEELVVLLDRYCRVALEEDAFEDPLHPRSEVATSQSLLRPFGVFGVIAPFNYPAVQGAGPAIAALLVGNTAVIKPAHLGPRSAHEFIELVQECDLPPGVVNMVQGGDQAGKALVAGDVDGIAFTGSYAAGMAIFRAMQSGPFPRPVIAEMGGSNPVIVTETADLERAAEGIAISAFGLSGQRCSALSRVIVAEEVHDELVGLVAARTAELAVGDPIDPDMFVGPLIESRVAERFDEVVEEAQRDGAIAAGGKRVDEFGYAVEPTVIVDLPPGHRLTREELFMPLITVTKVSGFEEAVTEANDTELGLTAGIYTGKPEEARAYLQRAEAGCVDVNVPRAATTSWWPGAQTFGGWKGSGSTSKQAFGRWYMQQFARERCQSIANDFDL